MQFPNWYVPKKLILLFDIFLTIFSLILAYLIRFDFIDFYELASPQLLNILFISTFFKVSLIS